MQPTHSTPTFTSPRIALVEKDNLRALCTVKVLDAVFLTGLRICEGKHGLFISMPSKKNPHGEYVDIFFPASKLMRDELSALLLKAYAEEKERAAGVPA